MRTAPTTWFLRAVLLACLVGAVFMVWQRFTPAVNPDPNHAHADFAVWVDGKKLDFSAPQFMSEVPGEEHQSSSSNASAQSSAGTQHVATGALALRKYLHLHDGNGHVIHRHKPGLTLGDFFRSLGTVIDQSQDHALCLRFPQDERHCDTSDQHWQIVVNNAAPVAFSPEYVFQDDDKILILYPSAGLPVPDQIRSAWAQMTDDACLYSKTCPWRGKAPTEHCIADPTVPCVAQ